MAAGTTRRTVLLAGAAGAGTLLGAGPAAASGRRRPAALVVVRGRVFTAGAKGEAATAVAAGADGTILAVGSDREIRRLAGRGTQVLDAAGGTIMPGIHDGHMHPLGAAAQSLNPSLGNAVTTVAELQVALQGFLDATAAAEPDGWLQVTDWNPVGLLPAGTVATKAMLDGLRTSRPIYLQGSDFHNSLVNSRALSLAGVDASTPDPAAGEIVRDASGEPTGLLKDDAQFLVGQVVPPPSDADLIAAYARMAAFLAANGVTSFLDAATGEDSLKAYGELIGRGLLPQRVIPALLVDATTATDPAASAEYLADLRARYGDVPGMRLRTAKVFLDGVAEFPAQTAALLEPYLDADGLPTDNRGDLYVSRTDFIRLVARLDREGWQLHAHAIGDRAVRTALDAFEPVASRRRDLRHTIAHLELVHPQDLPRFARARTVASMQLQWAVRNAFTLDALRPYIGEGRWARLYPARTLARHGAVLAGGSDWPVDQFRPFNQMATAVDRRDVGGADPQPLGPGESLGRRQSLVMHTLGAAYQMQDADSGVLAPGRRADLVVLDRDITTGPVSEVREAAVRQTVIAGRVVHDASSASAASLAAVAAVRPAAAGTDRHTCCGH